MVNPTFTDMRPELGQPVEDLETPVVVADLDAMERNLKRFRELADEHDVAVRSHTKAHKTPAVARRQEEALEGGVLCQTLSEAEVMARYGIEDVLLVCPVVSEPKLDRLCWVADHVDRFAVLADEPEHVARLGTAAGRNDTTVGVVLEVDVGLGRLGVEPGKPAVDVAEAVREQPGLAFDGILGHDGHVPYIASSESELEELCAGVAADLEETVEALEGAGIGVDRVTSGATATAPLMAAEDVVTELDPGRYIFNDAALLEQGAVDRADCGATVVTTVIGRPTGDRAIVDAGSKTLSYVDGPDPVPVGRDDVSFYRKSSEHGFVDVSEADVAVGDRLEFVVPNLWAVANLHDTLPAVRDGRVEEVWHVEARGKDT
ncbi:alanine racemase [Salinirussus salinus]|uniref:alanine racemase n=1 Tax=Salinirussus salinus TaxID=1198300 RepID=UPI0013567E2A|nr:alanine racemase [Salinirussus salinus]